MNAVFLIIIGMAMFAFGWFVYSKFVAEKIYQLQEDFVTPAHELRDDIDYVPTNKYVLWGHHFTAVAGAAPIVGPAVAVYWGWLPAFLWVTIGTVFFAGIHDSGALWASVRHKGKSMGSVCAEVVGENVAQLLLVVIFLVLIMVNAVFGVVIAKESIATPTSIIPAWGAIVIALIIGQLIYRFKFDLKIVSLVGLVALYALVPIGIANPISLPEEFMGMSPMVQWILFLFFYAGTASLMPVWALLQPRDYINGIQLFIGLLLLYASVFIVSPAIMAPAINPNTEGAPSMFPLLFVTIACGAISGFHGIVSSGTTSKQVNNEKDVRFVGYLGAMGEGSLALASIIAAVAGLGLMGDPSWKEVYTSFGKGGAHSFVAGGGNIIAAGLGFEKSMGETLLALMLILFAGTTMDAGLRLQRYIIQEWGEMYKIPFLKPNLNATLIAVATCLIVAFGAGEGGKGGLAIWPLFGTTNQILASLTLLVVSVFIMKQGRSAKVTLIPLVFILTVSFIAALMQLGKFIDSGKYVLAGINVVVIITTVLVVLKSIGIISKLSKEQEAK